MRPIDADAILKHSFDGYYREGDFDVFATIIPASVIENASTIEAKPVVYCKDCKYNVANRQQDPLDITDYTDIVCDYFMTDGMEADDFCSKGVKIPVISMEDVPKLMEEMEK